MISVQASVVDLLSAELLQVVEAGGLHVVGTERHESRRIDNQVSFKCLMPGDLWLIEVPFSVK